MKSNFKAQVDMFELIGKYHGNISRVIKNLLDLTDGGELIRKNEKEKFEWNRKGLTIEIYKDKHEQMAFIRIFVELPILLDIEPHEPVELTPELVSQAENKILDILQRIGIDNEAMRQGRDLEDYVAQRFTETTGLKVRRANAIYQSEEHPLLLADFDRLIVGQKAGLECKTVSPFSADKWTDGKIPAHYLAQVDHYLAVSGFDCWYVAALIFGRELVIHKIVTDKQVLSDLIDKEERFWTNHIVPQIPPAPNGCECDTQQINQLYEVDNRDKTADLSALHGLLDKRQELSDQIEQMEQEKTAIEQQVKLQMQDAAYGTAPGYKVSWISSESKRVDSQRLRKEQPDIFNQYSKNVSSRRFTIVHAA